MTIVDRIAGKLNRTNLPLTAHEQDRLIVGIELGIQACHGAAFRAGWWSNIETGEPLARNKGECLMLIVSEIAEAMEGERKDLMDDHLPARKMVEVELADAMIRIFDYAGAHNYDIAGALVEKLQYNASRADHKIEARQKADGKKF